MAIDRFYLITLLFILAGLGYLNYQVFQPFLTAITWAIVFCVVFYPAYVFLLRFVRVKAIASLVTLLLILLVIIGPFSYIAFAIIGEIKDFTAKTEAGNSESIKVLLSDERVRDAIHRVQEFIGIKGIPVEDAVLENIKKIGKWVIDKFSAGFTNVFAVAANFVFMSFTIFFLLKDGPGFFARIRDYIPFSEQQKDKLAAQVKDMIVSTIYGGVVVAIVQGILGGIAFTFLDIGSPVVWGSVMAIMSFVPMLGTSIIWGPAAAFLLLEGLYVKGIVLILIGIFVISMVDNILKPLIIGGRTKLPTVIIFFSVFGGIKFFGLLGLVLGPLMFALFVSVLEIFRTMEGGHHA